MRIQQQLAVSTNTFSYTSKQLQQHVDKSMSICKEGHATSCVAKCGKPKVSVCCQR